MLLKLPLDLLINIALFLPFSDKLQLVLTCKRLKDAILERCLYETLELTTDKKDTESIVLEFRKNRSRGNQVKFLNINLDHLSNQLYNAVPLIFPSVTNFDVYSNKKSRPKQASVGFLKWKDTLEDLENLPNKNDSIMYQLLEKNIFSRLTNLCISPLKNDDGSYTDILDYIRNAPALERLHISQSKITLKNMEFIHSECPSLVTFEISSSVIVVSENEILFKEIIPSSRLSRFSLRYSGICDQQCLFLTYLTQKYIKLVELEFHPLFHDFVLDQLFRGQKKAQMVSNPDYVEKRNELAVTSKSYTTSGSKMLSNLTGTLRFLKITSFDIQDPMTIFSKMCLSIRRLEFFGDSFACNTIFTSSENLKMLENLPFLSHLSIMLDSSIQEFEQVTISTSVTQLKLIFKRASPDDDMDVGCILSMFPSVNALNILYSGTRLIGYESDPPKTYPNLTTLTIGPSGTHPNLLKFICHSAPNLKDLYWCIFGKYIKKESEDQLANQIIHIHPTAPEMENGKPHYIIDLTGCSLNCLHLDIDLREVSTDENGEIILGLTKNEGETAYFNVSKDARCVTFVDYNAKHSRKKQLKAIVTVRYDNTKMIILNPEISIDLEKSQLQMNY